MWKASAGRQQVDNLEAVDDDWDTDPDFINDVSEQEQRWGSKTIEGSGRTAGTINMKELRNETEKSDADKKKKQIEESNPGYGYGGKFGLESDRMDKSAMGHDYIGKVEKHASQKDYSTGFGGKFGVQEDRVDKSAVNWDHKEKVVKHSSQKDYSDGFGGKYGVQTDRIDKSAHGWDYVEKVEKHESQKDYSKGFGGKFGVQEDRKDASAHGWDHIESVEKHESQTDHKKGYKVERSEGYSEPEKVGTAYTKVKPDIGSAKPSNLRAKFENLAKISDEDGQKKAAEQKKLREEKDRKDKEEAAKKQVFGDENVSKPIQRKGAISTGREIGIGNAISAFNKPQSTNEVTTQRKEQIQLPKKDITPKVTPPDVIPDSLEKSGKPIESRTSISYQEEKEEEIKQELEPELLKKKVHVQEEPISVVPESFIKEDTTDIYANVSKVHKEEDTKMIPDTVVSNLSSETNTPTDEDVSQYIEDTGVSAIALYDYQAAANDEISFDPDDIITHIEKIDEGWWRGLSKNKYGLFPANYVQLQN